MSLVIDFVLSCFESVVTHAIMGKLTQTRRKCLYMGFLLILKKSVDVFRRFQTELIVTKNI